MYRLLLKLNHDAIQRGQPVSMETDFQSKLTLSIYIHTQCIYTHIYIVYVYTVYMSVCTCIYTYILCICVYIFTHTYICVCVYRYLWACSVKEDKGSQCHTTMFNKICYSYIKLKKAETESSRCLWRSSVSVPRGAATFTVETLKHTSALRGAGSGPCSSQPSRYLWLWFCSEEEMNTWRRAWPTAFGARLCQNVTKTDWRDIFIYVHICPTAHGKTRWRCWVNTQRPWGRHSFDLSSSKLLFLFWLI